MEKNLLQPYNELLNLCKKIKVFILYKINIISFFEEKSNEAGPYQTLFIFMINLLTKKFKNLSFLGDNC